MIEDIKYNWKRKAPPEGGVCRARSGYDDPPLHRRRVGGHTLRRLAAISRGRSALDIVAACIRGLRPF